MYDCSIMLQALGRARSGCAYGVRILGTMILLAWLGGCASHHVSQSQAGRGMYKVGAPYTIDGITYTPQEEFQHVETGVASWYGPGFHGKYTANGEVYDQSDHTAAHRTLQMPSIVRVTNLDNGQTTMVRINDRGPYARSRVLDVSRAAAEDLGMTRNGTAHVRIEQMPMESQVVKDIAVNGGGASEQQAALERYAAGRRGPPPVMAAAQATPPPSDQSQTVWASNPRSPAVAPMQASGSAGEGRQAAPAFAPGSTTPAVFHPAGAYYVQTGAFATMNNAERQRGLIGTYGTTEIFQGSAGGKDVYRVRVGPYTTSDAAGIVADRLKRSGYGDARVVSD